MSRHLTTPEKESTNFSAISTVNALSNGHITPVQQMVSSGAGAIIVSLFMTPLDVVKIRLQAQDRLHQRKCFLYSNGLMDHLCPRLNGDPVPEMILHSPEDICNCKWYNRPKYFNGTLDAMLKISRVEGVKSLWSGLSPTLVLAVPNTIIYFTTYEQLRYKLGKYSKNDTLIALSSGALARIWACSIVSPLELIRTKMQSQKMAFYQVRQALSVTLKSEGVLGLWKGYSATLLRDVPFSALYWGVYEQFRPKEYNFQQNFIAGALSGTIASTITLPMDVIKTRLQMELGEKIVRGNGLNGKGRLKSIVIARDIISNDGVKGLFAGLIPRLVKVAPACAIMISSYEYCKRYFALSNHLRE